jgi:phytanoyl-CoA dioxygenase PhyH
MPYAEYGFEILPFLSPDRLQGIRAAINERMDAAVAALGIARADTFPEDPIGLRLERIAARDPILGEALLLAVYRKAHLDGRIAFLDGHAPLRALAERLTGKTVTSFTLRVRANVPSLPGRRQGWHSDVSILDGGEFARVRIACWTPLSHADASNGTLEVAPGIRTFPMDHEGDPSKHTIREQDLAGSAKTIVECPEGSSVFLDAFVPHRAIPNRSGQVRWSVVAWMMSD